MSEVFSAHAQYDDWSGTVAADEANNMSIQQFVREKAGLPDNVFVVGVSMFEQTSTDGRPTIRAVLADGEGFDDVNAQVTAEGVLRFKEVDLQVTYDEFFAIFKRFSLVITARGLKLQGREYEIIE